MGRMKKEHKTIVDFEISVTYVCPVTKEKVTLNEINIIAQCDLCGSHGAIEIEVPVKCPSCKKSHYDIDYKSW